jgi:probable rRNA maturation factor
MTETKTADAATLTPSTEPRLVIDLQDARPEPRAAHPLPAPNDFERWAGAALAAGLEAQDRALPQPAELTIRITDEDESAALNQRYRDKNGPTNILSFAFEPPPGIVHPGLDAADPELAALAALLGDLIICAPVVEREAREQAKPLTAHWAHLVVHGVLHLLGFDHLAAADAASMEALEIRVLERLGFPSPYEVIDDVHGERRRI